MLEEKSGIMDVCEHFADEEEVHDREEFIIKNEESYTNSSDVEVDANQSAAFFNKEILQVLDPTSIKSEPVLLHKCEFPKCHLVGAREEKYLDESTVYEHTDHTYCSKDDKKRPVELEVEIFEQFIDNEGVHDREEYIIKNEETCNANQSTACFNKEMPPVLDPTSIKSDTVYLSDTHEQFIDEKGVHDREEYIIKNEKVNGNPLLIEGDENQSPTSFNEEMPPVLDPTSIKSDTVYLGIVDTREQFIDEKGVHDREEYIIKNEKTNPIMEGDAHQSSASVHLKIRNHKCHLCEHIASRKWDLQKHVERVHLDIKKHKCNLCEYAAYHKRTLELHIKSVHLKIKEHECHLCEYSTCRKGDLQKHIQHIHLDMEKNEGLKEHRCNQCEYITTRQVNLRNHVESVHLNIKKHKCHLCDYGAYFRRSLDLHIKSVHLNIKEHVCHLCEYSTNRKGNLRMHVETVHLDIKKRKCHLCHFCEYAASQKSKLDKHVKSVHYKIREHRCHLCEFAASAKQALDKHVKSIHLKIKEHRCHLCEYATSRKYLLKNHVDSTHLNIKRYKCHSCEYATGLKADLKKHETSIHLKIGNTGGSMLQV